MRSRERVLAALNHREPDRVPVDFSGHRASGIFAIAYARLRKHLGLERKPIRVYDPIQQLAVVDDDVLDQFGVDTIELGRAFVFDDAYWADWTLPDGTPCQMPVQAMPEHLPGEWVMRSKAGRIIARMPDGVLQFEQAYYPFADEANLEAIPAAFDECMWTAIVRSPAQALRGPEGLKRLREGARALRGTTSRAIIGLFGGNFLEVGQFMFRNDNFYMLLASEPSKAHAFLDRILEIHLANLETFLGAVGEYIDLIVFSDDLGMQTGPQMSLKMYREFFKPRHKLVWNRAKELANVKVLLHSCGSIRDLIPDLIEAGADAVQPVQISCSKMDAQELKREFGKDIVFWGGGCDTQDVLPYKTPEEVRRHVKEQVKILSPEGGFVFQQVHNIMAHVPPENIVAMFDAVNSGA